jgi:hypothetical protein
MKNTNFLQIFFLFLTTVLCLTYCTSSLEMKLNENPDFVKDAHKYIVTHPFHTRASNKPQTFIIEDVQTEDVYQTEVQWSTETKYDSYMDSFIKNTERKRITDTSDVEEGDVAEVRNFVTHKIIIPNPIDNKNYEVSGKVIFFSNTVEESNYEITILRFPIEFHIFEKDNEVGQIKIDKDWDINIAKYFNITISLNDRLLNLKFYQLFNKRKVSIEYEDQLVAFFDLKPAAFISTKIKGDALIKNGLSSDFLADLLFSYILTDIFIGAIIQL